MQNIYEQETTLGKMSRQILQTSFKPAKRCQPNLTLTLGRGRHFSETDDNPRLSLRWLSSYQNLGYITGGYLLSFCWAGIGPISYVLLLFLLIVLYAFLMSILKPIDQSGCFIKNKKA